MMGTLWTGRKRRARVRRCRFSWIRQEESYLTSARQRRKAFSASITLLTLKDVSPTNNNDPLRTVSSTTAWDESDPSGASLQSRPPLHNNSPRVKLSTQWCAQLLSHLWTWPLSGRIAPLGLLSFLLLAATSVFRLYLLNLDSSRFRQSQEAPCWV